MGGRRHRLSARKYHERTKPLSLIVCIDRAKLHVSLPISLPRELYMTCPVGSLSALKARFETQSLPAQWFLSSSYSSLSLFKIQHQQGNVEASCTVSIDETLQWSVSICGRTVTPMNSLALSSIPSVLNSTSCVLRLLALLDSCRLCAGNSEEKLLEVARHRESIQQGKGPASCADTVRHKDCHLLLNPDSKSLRCPACVQHRASLLVQAKRMLNTSRTAPSSHTNHRYLSRPELIDRLSKEHHERRLVAKQCQRLKTRIAEVSEKVGVSVNPEVHEGLKEIMVAQSDSILQSLPPNSFQELFWKQQLEAASKKDQRGMRWHPLMIRWCLYIHYRSSGAYESLRQSGVLKLPSQRTLRDYTHHTEAAPGFSAEVDSMLMKAAEIATCPERNKCILLLLDEMHVREDLVYDKHSGEFIGFANLGNINSHLDAFEQALSSSSEDPPPALAKTVMVFMVRGLFTKLQFAYVQFPCGQVRGDKLFDPFWEAVCRLEKCGLKVLGATLDGNSVNRRLIKLHDPTAKIVYKTPNPFTTEQRPLLFFSDPPHLVKTVRNCMLSKARLLWCNGKDISWRHISNLYYQDRRPGVGLTLLPKIKLEHIRLNSFSKMRVDLATQVLSESVAKALKLTGGSCVEETAKFVELMDKFFDCMNVHNFHHGFQARKPFQMPYRSGKDKRLQWLRDVFLAYLDDWEKLVNERPGFTREEKNRMLLSSETRLGLRMTTHSFIELVEYVFTLPDVKVFLSQRVTQDPLENFFGCQRQRGGTHDNPNVQEFQKNMQALRVVNSFAKGPVKGNCRGSKEVDKGDIFDKENCTLPKRVPARSRK